MWSLVVFSATLIDENTALTKWLNWIWFEFVSKFMRSDTEKMKKKENYQYRKIKKLLKKYCKCKTRKIDCKKKWIILPVTGSIQ